MLARPVIFAAVAISVPSIVIGGAMIVAIWQGPEPEPFVSEDSSRARLIPSRVLQSNTDADSRAPSRVLQSNAVADSRVLANARPPVPLVRRVKAPVAPHQPPEPLGEMAVEPEKTDELDKRAAQVAVEMDGYKRVSIIGKASNGAWRAKGYRGTTEVLLVVDGTGRVSME